MPRPKSPENYFMILGKYSYDPFEKDGIKYVRVAHRGEESYRAVIQLVLMNNSYIYRLVSSTMPPLCVNEFWPVLERNKQIFLEFGYDA